MFLQKRKDANFLTEKSTKNSQYRRKKLFRQKSKIAPRLTSHKFRGQTVYLLKSTLADVLYDQNGDVLCILRIEVKDLLAEKCRDFDVERNKGKLVWKMAEEKR